jgi:predicted nucleic acid-binding protein
LDSVILIDHLNGLEEATRFVLGLNPDETAISVITRAEVLAGIDEKDQNRVSLLLDQYQLFIIDRTVADLSAQLRRLYGWKLPDAMQAALAQFHRTKLSTRNTKDFSPEEHGFVEIPYLL